MKDTNKNLEKEAIRRNLLSTILISAYARRLTGSQSPWTSFWQGLFKKNS